MKKFVLPLLASLAVATPALADTRAEVRGGAIWSAGDSETTYGAAIGFDGDLYGETIEVELIDWLRDQCKFTGIVALKQQLVRDLHRVEQRRDLRETRSIAVG